MYFFLALTYFPHRGCLYMRSTITVTLFIILLDTTTPFRASPWRPARLSLRPIDNGPFTDATPRSLITPAPRERLTMVGPPADCVHATEARVSKETRHVEPRARCDLCDDMNALFGKTIQASKARNKTIFQHATRRAQPNAHFEPPTDSFTTQSYTSAPVAWR